jgi:Ssp1 endopeptidase immunity protein Rap1a
MWQASCCRGQEAFAFEAFSQALKIHALEGLRVIAPASHIRGQESERVVGLPDELGHTRRRELCDFKERKMWGPSFGLGRCAITVTVLLFFLVVGAAKAHVVSGNELWDNCQDSTKLPFCYGYILGAAQSYSVAHPIKSQPFFCLSPEVQNQQVLDVVTSYLHDHPENRQWPGPTLVIFALGEKFPCNKGR